ncbi:hypothetical protein FSP39_009791 [Pinctada imbricata]|uniref:Uncharacterized protein n=1 Tax=Pinctada imbricata TaxID=66713 RepID=A0AA89C316_PINIB|nr:hypothetical protein FSP39_009791 [Pinctada imbricata]
MGARLSFPKVQLTGKTIVVTGGNTGIGYETAKWLAMLGGHVIIACRSEERATKAIERMNEEYQTEKKHGTPDIVTLDQLDVSFLPLDCSSLKSSKEFIDLFLAKESQLHLLLFNAGIAAHEQEYTDDGYEKMFQVNYLSQFLVCIKLLPVMLASGPDCRIVLVSSYAHNFASFDVDKIQGKQYTKENFKRMVYYGNSKLYQILQMYSMNGRLSATNVTVNSIHPGAVMTELARDYRQTSMINFMYRTVAGLGWLRTPYQGATTLINAAVNPEFKDLRNVYFQDCKATNPSRQARNKQYQEQLWKYTLECLKDYVTDEDLKCLGSSPSNSNNDGKNDNE